MGLYQSGNYSLTGPNQIGWSGLEIRVTVVFTGLNNGGGIPFNTSVSRYTLSIMNGNCHSSLK